MAVSSSMIRILARVTEVATPIRLSCPQLTSLGQDLVLPELESEGASLIHRARHPDVASVHLGDVPREGQTQTGPLHLPGEVVLSPIELLEDLPLFPLGNSDPAIDDLHGDFIDRFADIHHDF